MRYMIFIIIYRYFIKFFVQSEHPAVCDWKSSSTQKLKKKNYFRTSTAFLSNEMVIDKWYRRRFGTYKSPHLWEYSTMVPVSNLPLI